MKALSLTQPWATLVALSEKRIETRSWPTRFRGEVAIHAAKGFPGWARRQCWIPPFNIVLARHGLTPDDLPLGKVVCITEVLDCLKTEHIREAWCHYSEAVHEDAFGNYGDNRYGFLFGRVLPVPLPIAARGALGFWEWEPSFPVMEAK
jgi:hypothetical protein